MSSFSAIRASFAVMPARLLWCALALAAVPPPAAARAATAARIIHALNLERAQNGIPAGIVQNRTWSHDCALHDRWMAENHTISHAEQSGTPGYTNAGNWAAANSVLAAGAGLDFNTPASNPYLSAPFHLAQILNPRLSVMGAAERYGADCETTFPGYRRRPPHRVTIFTFPGNGATIPWFEDAQEFPNVPGDQVGLPQGTTTGPNMIVFADGPKRRQTQFKLLSASLRGPGGQKVPSRMLDQSDWVEGGVGFVIPVSPLKPATTYTARITFARVNLARPHAHARKFSDSWSFTTTPLLTGAAAVKLSVTLQGQQVVAAATALDPAYAGRSATLHITVHYGDGTSTSSVNLVISRDYVYYGAPTHGEQLDFVLDVHGFHIGSTSVSPFTLGPVTISG